MELSAALALSLGGQSLDRDQARAVFSGALREDTDPILFGAFLAALAQRGEAPEEIVGAAQALRAAAVPFEHDHAGAIDTCGTGGDGLGSFNLSTAAAIVAAAAGATVIKHGNRSVSSECGSADLLEALGIELELSPDQARTVLDEVGITFLFAPRYHPAMRFAAPVRQALGVRTLFNFLGPLCNPGRVRRQLLGISDGERVADFAAALEGLGCERGYVVHGAGGADELTLEGENQAVPVGSAPAVQLDARTLGLKTCPVADLRGGGVPRNVEILTSILAGQQGPLRDGVLINAVGALLVAERAADGPAALVLAQEAIDSGAAARRLEEWVRASRAAAAGGPGA
jgi:anthranilate phosphoribosyltransferase